MIIAKLDNNGNPEKPWRHYLSIGVESTSDHILKNIGRNHDGKTALDSLRRAVKTGFDSVNADLMLALPGQTLKYSTILANGVKLSGLS